MDMEKARSLAQELESACREAERLGKRKLELESLQKTSFKDRLVAFVTALPAGIKSIIIKPSRPPKGLPKLLISLDLKPSFDLWKSDALSFFTEKDEKFKAYHCPLSGTYLLLSQLEKHDAADRARRRLLCVVFSLIKEQTGRVRLRKKTIDKLVHIITSSGLVVAHSVVIADNLRKWTGRGDKYRSLAEATGGLGSLLMLPEENGDSFWEQRIGKTGRLRDETVKRLRLRGIEEEAARIGAHDLANSIINYAVQKIVYQLSNNVLKHGDSTGEKPAAQVPRRIMPNQSPQVEDNRTEYTPITQQAPSGISDIGQDGKDQNSHKRKRTPSCQTLTGSDETAHGEGMFEHPSKRRMVDRPSTNEEMPHCQDDERSTVVHSSDESRVSAQTIASHVPILDSIYNMESCPSSSGLLEESGHIGSPDLMNRPQSTLQAFQQDPIIGDDSQGIDWLEYITYIETQFPAPISDGSTASIGAQFLGISSDILSQPDLATISLAPEPLELDRLMAIPPMNCQPTIPEYTCGETILGVSADHEQYLHGYDNATFERGLTPWEIQYHDQCSYSPQNNVELLFPGNISDILMFSPMENDQDTSNSSLV